MIPFRPVLRGVSDEATRPKHPSAGTPSAPRPGAGSRQECRLPRPFIENGLQFWPFLQVLSPGRYIGPWSRSAAIRNPVRGRQPKDGRSCGFTLGNFGLSAFADVGRPRQFCRGGRATWSSTGQRAKVPTCRPWCRSSPATAGLSRAFPAVVPVRRCCRVRRRGTPSAFSPCAAAIGVSAGGAVGRSPAAFPPRVPGDRLSAFPPCRDPALARGAFSGCAKGRSTTAAHHLVRGAPAAYGLLRGLPFQSTGDDGA